MLKSSAQGGMPCGQVQAGGAGSERWLSSAGNAEWSKSSTARPRLSFLEMLPLSESMKIMMETCVEYLEILHSSHYLFGHQGG